MYSILFSLIQRKCVQFCIQFWTKIYCCAPRKGDKEMLERLERYQAIKDDTEEFNGGDVNTRRQRIGQRDIRSSGKLSHCGTKC